MVGYWTARFNDTFASPASAVYASTWQEVFGNEYPPSLDTYSYVSVTELRRIAKDLRIGDGNRFADVGCGRGGPSLWVAAQTGAALVGVDIAETALRAGRERANALALSDRATFLTGAFEDLPLDSEDLDGVMSIDALLFTADKAAALRELARVLRPGARLVLTTWDYDRQPDGRPPQVDDHRPLLQDAASTSTPTRRRWTGVAVSTGPQTDCSPWSTRSRLRAARTQTTYVPASRRCARAWTACDGAS